MDKNNSNTKKRSVFNIKSSLALVITLATIAGGVFFIEDRYAKAEETTKNIKQLKQETEKTFIQLRKDLKKDALYSQKQYLINTKWMLKTHKSRHLEDPEIDSDIKLIEDEIKLIDKKLEKLGNSN